MAIGALGDRSPPSVAIYLRVFMRPNNLPSGGDLGDDKPCIEASTGEVAIARGPIALHDHTAIACEHQAVPALFVITATDVPIPQDLSVRGEFHDPDIWKVPFIAIRGGDIAVGRSR